MNDVSFFSSVGQIAQKQGELTKLKKACDGMESSFLRQLLQTMRESAKSGDDPLAGGAGSDTYRDMADGALADRLAERGTLGISKMAFKEMAPQILNAKETR